MNPEALKYPIGKPSILKQIKRDRLNKWITTLEVFPTKVANEIQGLSIQDMNLKYRPDGWTIRQVIGHCLDSHMNSFIRFKLALTEYQPLIKPYKEDQWANLPDSLDYDIDEVMQGLSNLHKRWVFLLKGLTAQQWERTFIHPEGNETISLKKNLALYAWHCDHHLQHIINAKTHKN